MPLNVQFYQAGGPEVLQLEEIKVPAPGPGEVQIEVKAIGLNRAESMYRSGMYLENPRFPSKIGYEASGLITAVGSNVEHVRVGDAVSTVPAFSMNDYGTYGELIIVPGNAVVKHSTTLSWIEATSIWMQYLTAYGALHAIAHMTSEDVVLIPAASSSVGIAAIQMVNLAGATPIALTRTSKKRDELLQLGARHVIATEEQDIAAEVMRLTNGTGARIVFDPVGGPTVAKLVSAMAPGGILFLYGALSVEATPLPLFEVLGKCLTIRGYLLFEITQDTEHLKTAVEFVNAGLASGGLHPIIAQTFPLREIVAAHTYLESNQQIGKVVVTVP